MLTDGEPTDPHPTDQNAPRQYLVKCEVCSFERATDGRDEAAKIGNSHHRETRHEVIAVEVPPSIGSS